MTFLATGGAGLLMASARQNLRQQLSLPWVPPHCRKALLKRRQKFSEKSNPEENILPQVQLLPLGDSQELVPFQANFLLSPTSKIHGRHICPSSLVKSRLLVQSVLAAHAGQLQKAQTLPFVSASSTNLGSPSLLSPNSRSSLDILTQKDMFGRISPSSDSLVTPLSPLSPQDRSEEQSAQMSSLVKKLDDMELSKEKNEEKIEELKVSCEKLHAQKMEIERQIELERDRIEKVRFFLNVYIYFYVPRNLTNDLLYFICNFFNGSWIPIVKKYEKHDEIIRIF